MSLFMRPGIWEVVCGKGYGVKHKLGHTVLRDMGSNLCDHHTRNAEKHGYPLYIPWLICIEPYFFSLVPIPPITPCQL